ncbi:hypothetical protein RRG08_066076 [Elysia crispata]|uniref:Intimal thickness related receptor IRP domain-containing protein n=1 Tax=Elysia crispata TaxID=231223 RepID=A0AAE0YFF7_9GAST|nr:hypothetical protein RRG08_066076 [Elysia crispata]
MTSGHWSRFSVSALLQFLTFILCSQNTDAKWTEGTIIDENGDWIFLTRFCFLSKVGKMHYQLEYPQDFEVENLLFYYDVPGQWDAVYKRGLNCNQKVAALNGKNIFEMDSPSLCGSTIREGRYWFECNGTMDFSSSRERWWYVTVSRCGAPSNTQVSGLYLYYKLHMTNGDDLLHQEFSADEFYILLIDIIFFILYLKIMVLSIFCAVKLRNRQLFHSTYKLYLASVTLWTTHLLCMVIAWGSYGNTGWEMRRMEVLGRIFAAGSNVIFILMLILLAKGYTIVRGRLTNKAMIKITTFICLYVIVSVALFIWEGAFFDPGLVLYYYESPPGYCMVAIILLGWLWFTKAAVFTLKHFKAKTNFYIAFYTIYTIWFWASPVIILVAMFSMAKWTREKTVNGVQQFVAYLGHLIFLILTMPNKVNTNFPYHIKTSQIGSVPDDSPLTGEDSARTDEDGSSRGRQTPGAYTLSPGAYYSGTGPNLEFFITTKADTRQAGGEGGTMYAPLDLNNFGIQDVNSQPPLNDGYQDPYAAATKPDASGGDSHHQPHPVPNGHIATQSEQHFESKASDRDNNSNIDSFSAPNNSNIDSFSAPNNSNIDSFSAPNNSNRLPPLNLGPENGGPSVGRAGTLPPIGRTGTVPSAPPNYEIGGEESSMQDSPPSYVSLFSANKS